MIFFPSFFSDATHQYILSELAEAVVYIEIDSGHVVTSSLASIYIETEGPLAYL